MDPQHRLVPIIPSADLDASQAFYERLGFEVESVYPTHGYRILRDAQGASVHLTGTVPGWVVPERNAYGVYFYAENVDELAARFGLEAQDKPWGLREFAVSDPSGTLVRIGWPR
ncbi:glyoxalase [Stigmatella sp. ncwal1]|uniref:Glyoxalase n=1 Tax=Stigmatella ashevillensis TaxID=2995309 RepID=A0ABT5DDM4_9BACT|nr:VOC family protein [Stigmatella ashevillena]MDC0711757.1 glyoxalase [Stigmatella ashevillena]